MNYQFQEGAITLPDEEYQDNSLNMLRFLRYKAVFLLRVM